MTEIIVLLMTYLVKNVIKKQIHCVLMCFSFNHLISLKTERKENIHIQKSVSHNPSTLTNFSLFFRELKNAQILRE